MIELLSVPPFPNEQLMNNPEYVAGYSQAVSKGPQSFVEYGHLLAAIGSGKSVECLASDGTWFYQHPGHTLQEIQEVINGPEKYRIAPEQQTAH